MNELYYIIPRTKKFELEVQKIIHLQSLVKRSDCMILSTANVPIKFDVTVGQYCKMGLKNA